MSMLTKREKEFVACILKIGESIHSKYQTILEKNDSKIEKQKLRDLIDLEDELYNKLRLNPEKINDILQYIAPFYSLEKDNTYNKLRYYLQEIIMLEINVEISSLSRMKYYLSNKAKVPELDQNFLELSKDKLPLEKRLLRKEKYWNNRELLYWYSVLYQNPSNRKVAADLLFLDKELETFTIPYNFNPPALKEIDLNVLHHTELIKKPDASYEKMNAIYPLRDIAKECIDKTQDINNMIIVEEENLFVSFNQSLFLSLSNENKEELLDYYLKVSENLERPLKLIYRISKKILPKRKKPKNQIERFQMLIADYEIIGTQMNLEETEKIQIHQLKEWLYVCILYFETYEKFQQIENQDIQKRTIIKKE